MSNPRARASSALATLDTRLPPPTLPLALSCPTAALVRLFLTRHKLVIINPLPCHIQHLLATCYLCETYQAGSELVRRLAYKVSYQQLSGVIPICALPLIHVLIETAQVSLVGPRLNGSRLINLMMS
jgi:hypothetical protein